MSVDCDVTRVYKRYACELKTIEKKKKENKGRQAEEEDTRGESRGADRGGSRSVFFERVCET